MQYIWYLSNSFSFGVYVKYNSFSFHKNVVRLAYSSS